MWINKDTIDQQSLKGTNSIVSVSSSFFINFYPKEVFEDCDSVLGLFDIYERFLVNDIVMPLDDNSPEYNLLTTIKTVWYRIALAPYVGEKIELNSFELNDTDPIEKEIIHALSEKGYPEFLSKQILYLSADKKTVAIFHPGLGCFVPSGNVIENVAIYNHLVEQQPECAVRVIAYLDCMLQCKREIQTREINNYFGKIKALKRDIDDKHQRLITVDETGVFNEEKALTIPENIRKYIGDLSYNVNISGLSGYFGNRTESIFVENPIFILAAMNNSTEVIGNVGLFEIDNCTYLLPPFTCRITEPHYSFVKMNEYQFLVVTANKDGVKHRKIYSKLDEWDFACPDWVIDLNYHLDERDLKIFTYVLKESINEVCQNRKIVSLSFKIEDVDNDCRVAKVGSGNDVNQKWRMLQRHIPLKYIAYYDEAYECRGVIIPPTKERADRTEDFLISLDPGGDSSTILVFENQKAHGPEYDQIYWPLVPMPRIEFEKIVDYAFDDYRKQGEVRRESRIQEHHILDGETLTSQWLYRNNPKSDYLFEKMIEEPLDGDKLFKKRNIYTNLKMPLSQGEATEEKCKQYAMYIANVIRPVLFYALREGYTLNRNISRGKIKVLVAFPDNGDQDKNTLVFKKSIADAFGYLNELLSDSNRFIENRNFFMLSEASATATFQIKINNLLTQDTPVLVADIGATTSDLDFRRGKKNFTMSIPYAGDDITIRSMISVFVIDKNMELIKKSYTNSDIATKIGNPIYNSLDKNTTIRSRRNNEGVRLILSYAFQKSEFDISYHHNEYQNKLRECTEQRLLTLVPYVARIVSTAFKQKLIGPNEEIIFIPCGNGSKAFKNARTSFVYFFLEKVVVLVKRETGIEGIEKRIKVYDSGDVDKRSVAMGMIYMKLDEKQNEMDTVNVSEKEEEFAIRINRMNVFSNESKKIEGNEIYNYLFESYSIDLKNYLITDVLDLNQKNAKQNTERFVTFSRRDLKSNSEHKLSQQLFTIIKKRNTVKDLLRIVKEDYKDFIMSDLTVALDAITLAMYNEMIDLVIQDDKVVKK